jgi:Carbohydrate binding domain (family 11)
MSKMRLRLALIACCVWACSKAPSAHQQLPSADVEGSAPPIESASSAPLTVTPTPPPCAPSAAISPDKLLDDFEDGDSELLPFAGRNGAWFVANDQTPSASIHPAAGPANPERLEVPRCSSRFALHFAGEGFVTWGAVIGVTPRFDKVPEPVDWSAYRGIHFWVRSSEKRAGVLRFNIDDAQTHPNGGQCYKPASKEKDCWNSFGVDLPVLSSDWQERSISFDSLTQKYPAPKPSKVDSTKVFRISFKTSPGNPFDLWIDDVSLFE